MSRQYPQRPILAVGALVVKDGLVLLAKRGKEPNLGKWSLPGGAVKLGEGLKEAVKREIREECGLEVEVEEISEIVERRFWDDAASIRYHYVIVDYLATWKGGELAPASDVLEARWVAPDELDQYDLTEGTLDVIGRLLARAREVT